MKMSISCLLKSVSKSHNFDKRNQGCVCIHVLWRNLKKIKMARSTGVCNPPKLLLTIQTFDVFILISHILYFIYMQRLAIQFVEMHCTRTHISFLYIDQHPGNNFVLLIEHYLQTDTCLQWKKITSVFLFKLLQFDYEVWEIIIYFTTCFSFILISYKESR